jgi:hypothetical protein
MSQIPNREKAYVSARKLREYLLSETHAIGKAKARFFRALGFNENNLGLLELELIAIARRKSVKETVRTPFGIKYIVDGVMSTPVGTSAKVRTIWIVESNDKRPRFVTAYPVRTSATYKRSTE